MGSFSLNDSLMSEVFSTGTVRGRGTVGGLAGELQLGASIENSFSTSDILPSPSFPNGPSGAGGLVGMSGPTSRIVNSYASGIIEAHRTVLNATGGIVGDPWTGNPSTLIQGTVAINPSVRGGNGTNRIVGDGHSANPRLHNNLAYHGMVLTRDRFVINVNQQNPTASSVHGRSTTDSALRQRSTYVGIGWDFNSVWDIEEGVSYPFLRNLPNPHNF